MFEIWKALAGIAVFILGMNFLEEALHSLSGRKFKLFIRKQTLNPVTAIGGGAVTTALLQSSSVVNLIVLALVGAGTIPMRNALAVILGSNLGTTLSTWIIAAVGFRFNIEYIALPAIALAGISRTIFRNRVNTYNWLSLLLGLGLLFLGLELIKTGMGNAIKSFDIGILQQYPVFIYVIAGLLITSLIQSSSATVAIALSALYADAISLYAATAVVLGSEIGTTLKLLIAASGREPSMKRVALGNFLFNIINTVIIFLFLSPVNKLITSVLSIRDPLMALAFFQTFINFFSIILFYPFLNLFGRFLERRFTDNSLETRYIGKVPVTDTDLAVNAMEQETLYFLKTVIQYSVDVFEADGLEQFHQDIPKSFSEKNLADKYTFIKHLHGDIYAYYTALQNTVTDKEQTKQLEQLIAAVRNGMYAAKSIKDADFDIAQLRNSSNETKYKFYWQSREKASVFFVRLSSLMQQKNETTYFNELVSIYQLVQSSYTSTLNELYRNDQSAKLSEIEISTVINFNREMYTALKSLVLGVKDALLDNKEARYFDDLPGFIR